jgi:hypothetical protein
MRIHRRVSLVRSLDGGRWTPDARGQAPTAKSQAKEVFDCHPSEIWLVAPG